MEKNRREFIEDWRAPILAGMAILLLLIVNVFWHNAIEEVVTMVVALIFVYNGFKLLFFAEKVRQRNLEWLERHKDRMAVRPLLGKANSVWTNRIMGVILFPLGLLLLWLFFYQILFRD